MRWIADATAGEVLYEEDQRARIHRMIDAADPRLLQMIDRLLQLAQQ